jgi:hypothetical protein
MMRRRRPMTIAQLKLSLDHRFTRVDRRLNSIDRRLESLRAETRKDKDAIRRHFDVVAESLRDDFRIFADAIARQSSV